MPIPIRENIPAYLDELRRWLAATEQEPLERMDDFFAARLADYEAHMAVWDAAYDQMAALLPEHCGPVLDLGCGTGLELDRIFARWPLLEVTGVDLCVAMLARLREKHAGRRLTLLCADYLTADFGTERWGAVISVESLHHFTPAQKAALYQKLFDALRPGGFFLEADYLACCDEEEALLRAAGEQRRARAGAAPDALVHFDTPLTQEHELALLRGAGFAECAVLGCAAGAALVRGVRL